MTEEEEGWAGRSEYELATVAAVGAVSKSRVILRVYCGQHDKQLVAQVRDVPSHGALLVANRRLSRTRETEALRAPLEEWGYRWPRDRLGDVLLERPDRPAGNVEGWCKSGKHPALIDVDKVHRRVTEFRNGAPPGTLTV